MSLKNRRIPRSDLVKWMILALVMLTGDSAYSSPSNDPHAGATNPNPDRGMYVFQAYCVGCHGQNGRGDGPMAGKLFRDFATRPTDLAAVAFQDSLNDVQMSQTIRGGEKASHKTPYMPAWGTTLTDRQMTDLVAFIRELKPRATEIVAPIVSVGDQLELGRVLYTVRCLACHGPKGAGDGPFIEGLTLGGSTLVALPDFSNSKFFHQRSDQDLEDVLYRGISHSGLLPETEPGWWERALDEDEKPALFFYLRALSIQAAQLKT